MNNQKVATTFLNLLAEFKKTPPYGANSLNLLINEIICTTQQDCPN